MDEFKYTYQRLCKEYSIDPQECVLAVLKTASYSSSAHTVLDFSTNGIPPKNCAVLGKVLAADHTVTDVKLADSMLNDEGVKGITQGLSCNTCCKTLDLKGNNIRGSGAEVLGKMLKYNSTLTSLCLEWNGLGMFDSSFTLFCEGVGSNTHLRSLDLRNNQISHDGGSELATNLRRNTTLRSLDLRWNNIGLLGGRSLLEMLQSNKTLTKLELAGNNIPCDTVRAIETAICNNADRQAVTDEHTKRAKTLTKHIKQIHVDKDLQMKDLMDTVDRQEEIMRKSKRSSASNISQLHEALEDRRSAFNTLSSKMALTESELTLSEQKASDHNLLIGRLQGELSDSTKSYHAELKREREERIIAETKILKELSESNDRNITLESKLEDVERKCKQYKEQIYDLKEQTTHIQADLKIKAAQFEEQLSQSKTMQKDALRELEHHKDKDVSRARQDSADMEKLLKDRIAKMEVNRAQLDEEITALKSSAAADRLQADEQLQLTKQRMKTDEDHRVNQLQDKARVLQAAKDELQSHNAQQSGTIGDLQSRSSHLTMEVESLKRRLEDANLELAGKNSEVVAEVGKVKMELTQYQQKMDGERMTQSELREKLEHSDKQLSEQTLRHRETVEQKDRELCMLQEKLKARDLELTRMREEDVQRTSMLQSAIMTYCNRSPSIGSYTPESYSPQK